MAGSHVEDRASTSLARLGSLWLGRHRYCASRYRELGWLDGSSILPRYLRSWIWTWHPLLAEFLLPATRGRLSDRYFSICCTVVDFVLRCSCVRHHERSLEVEELEIAVPCRGSPHLTDGSCSLFLLTCKQALCLLIEIHRNLESLTCFGTGHT